jgi:hypothetical protein
MEGPRIAYIASGILQVTLADGSLLADCGLELLLEVSSGHIRGLVPGVIVGGLVDLGQLVLRWVDFVCNLGGTISNDVAEKDVNIAH